MQPNIEQIRHSIRDIDDSYNHSWDVLAELCQNAVDAVRKSSIPRGHIRLEIDSIERSISIADDGIGIAPEKLPGLLKPFSTDKADDEQTIGEKGVGLTFVIFACNDFYIKSGNGQGTGEGFVKDAFLWKNSTEPNELLLSKNPVNEAFQGTVVRAQKSKIHAFFI